ncbi:10024_t:CDS:1, partial [Racocetra persica]
THFEISLLTKDFDQLKALYQPKKDYEIKMKKILETNELFSESTYHIENEEKLQYPDNQVLTPLQIKKFKLIFSQNTIEEKNDKREINKKLMVILD